MYIKHFFTSLTKKNNIPIVIYLALNVIIITLIIYNFLNADGNYGPNGFVCFLIAVALYLVSIVVALSPFGEWILRLQNGCKKIKRKEQIAIIEPIFNEVYAKARELNPDISDNITLYIKGKNKKKDEADEINAFALGRNTICITEGLLSCSEEEIKAVLGHEFGHLAHHDTDVILVITVGNFIITTIITIVTVICTILKLFFAGASEGKDGAPFVVGLIMTAFFLLLINLANRVWSQIGVWLCMKSSRENEYLADEFSFNLGYGVSLCKFLDEYAGDSHAEGLFAALASSHPDTNDRVSRLQDLGCEYVKNYR